MPPFKQNLNVEKGMLGKSGVQYAMWANARQRQRQTNLYSAIVLEYFLLVQLCQMSMTVCIKWFALRLMGLISVASVLFVGMILSS